MMYAISLDNGLLDYDVSFEAFEKAKADGKRVWQSSNGGLSYSLVIE